MRGGIVRILKRNKRPFWYCLYNGETELTDSSGNYTGETGITYAEPVECKANISPATGQSNQEMFGNLTDYDRVILSDDPTLPIDENTVIWIEKDHLTEPHDYVVRRVARSLNSVAIAVRKVDVS